MEWRPRCVSWATSSSVVSSKVTRSTNAPSESPTEFTVWMAPWTKPWSASATSAVIWDRTSGLMAAPSTDMTPTKTIQGSKASARNAAQHADTPMTATHARGPSSPNTGINTPWRSATPRPMAQRPTRSTAVCAGMPKPNL